MRPIEPQMQEPLGAKPAAQEPDVLPLAVAVHDDQPGEHGVAADPAVPELGGGVAHRDRAAPARASGGVVPTEFREVDARARCRGWTTEAADSRPWRLDIAADTLKFWR